MLPNLVMLSLLVEPALSADARPRREDVQSAAPKKSPGTRPAPSSGPVVAPEAKPSPLRSPRPRLRPRRAARRRPPRPAPRPRPRAPPRPPRRRLRPRARRRRPLPRPRGRAPPRRRSPRRPPARPLRGPRRPPARPPADPDRAPDHRRPGAEGPDVRVTEPTRTPTSPTTAVRPHVRRATRRLGRPHRPGSSEHDGSSRARVGPSRAHRRHPSRVRDRRRPSAPGRGRERASHRLSSDGPRSVGGRPRGQRRGASERRPPVVTPGPATRAAAGNATRPGNASRPDARPPMRHPRRPRTVARRSTRSTSPSTRTGRSRASGPTVRTTPAGTAIRTTGTGTPPGPSSASGSRYTLVLVLGPAGPRRLGLGARLLRRRLLDPRVLGARPPGAGRLRLRARLVGGRGLRRGVLAESGAGPAGTGSTATTSTTSPTSAATGSRRTPVPRATSGRPGSGTASSTSTGSGGPSTATGTRG